MPETPAFPSSNAPAIVVGGVAYGDSSRVVRLLTQTHGLVPLWVANAAKQKALWHPMALLEVVVVMTLVVLVVLENKEELVDFLMLMVQEHFHSKLAEEEMMEDLVIEVPVVEVDQAIMLLVVTAVAQVRMDGLVAAEAVVVPPLFMIQ